MSQPGPNPGPSSAASYGEPRDRDDGSRRLQFFTGAVASVNGRALNSLIDRSRKGEFGESAKAATSSIFSDRIITSTVKTMSAVFIYLVAVDQGPAAPEWMHTFLSTSVRALDRMVDGPAVKEIMQLFEFSPGYEICGEAADEVSRLLGISQLTRDFAVPVRQFLEGSQKMRTDILQFALTEPYDELDRKLDELRPRR